MTVFIIHTTIENISVHIRYYTHVGYSPHTLCVLCWFGRWFTREKFVLYGETHVCVRQTNMNKKYKKRDIAWFASNYTAHIRTHAATGCTYYVQYRPYIVGCSTVKETLNVVKAERSSIKMKFLLLSIGNNFYARLLKIFKKT